MQQALDQGQQHRLCSSKYLDETLFELSWQLGGATNPNWLRLWGVNPKTVKSYSLNLRHELLPCPFIGAKDPKELLRNCHLSLERLNCSGFRVACRSSSGLPLISFVFFMFFNVFFFFQSVVGHGLACLRLSQDTFRR